MFYVIFMVINFDLTYLLHCNRIKIIEIRHIVETETKNHITRRVHCSVIILFYNHKYTDKCSIYRTIPVLLDFRNV